MTKEEQRIAIAEACGFHELYQAKNGKLLALIRLEPNDYDRTVEVPNYLSDLNAMHEAEKTLTQRQRIVYVNQLRDVVGHSWWETAHATAAQRSEAFLRTLNLWKD